MNMKHLSFDFNVKSLDETGTFSGYASVFGNRDSEGDVVQKGAFARTLAEWAQKGRLPPMLWQHDRKQPIGCFTLMKEDDKGLYVEGKLLIDDIPQAKTAHALLKNKVLGGMSVGYSVQNWEYDKFNNILNLLELKLYEVSLVTFPANEQATVDNVKHGLPDRDVIVKHLTDLGLSQKQAEAFCDSGLKSLQPENREKQDLINATNILKDLNK